MDISIDGMNLVIDDTVIDLTPYAGQKVTVFQEDDGSLTVESRPTHHLAICELEVPEIQSVLEDTGKTDTEGKPIMKETKLPLDLSKATIKELDLGGAKCL